MIRHVRSLQAISKLESQKLEVRHENFEFITATDRVIIVGAAGQGKTVSAFNIIDMLHTRGENVNWLCPLKAFDLKKQKKKAQNERGLSEMRTVNVSRISINMSEMSKNC